MKSAATNIEPPPAMNVEPPPGDIKTTKTKTDIPVVNTVTEPVEDKPKLPLWKAALKQRKEVEVKKKDEEQKKLVSNHFSIAQM